MRSRVLRQLASVSSSDLHHGEVMTMVNWSIKQSAKSMVISGILATSLVWSCLATPLIWTSVTTGLHPSNNRNRGIGPRQHGHSSERSEEGEVHLATSPSRPTAKSSTAAPTLPASVSASDQTS